MYDSYRQSAPSPCPGPTDRLTLHQSPHLRHITLHIQIRSFISTPSVTVDPNSPDSKARYVISPSGEHAAHPDDVLAACNSLEQHLNKVRSDADQAINAWKESIKQRELAEKRRLAPGWLDREEKLLQPSRTSISPDAQNDAHPSLLDSSSPEQGSSQLPTMVPHNDGEELDRAFGGLGFK
ncbi:hypothetical protein N7491_000520 [Penicillium cf. griseofulvum]|nr:hypothetical protein N7491_000520 [Penicillium cf. griseofulvum]